MYLRKESFSLQRGLCLLAACAILFTGNSVLAVRQCIAEVKLEFHSEVPNVRQITVEPDLTGDGVPDLVQIDIIQARVNIFPGNGTGSFGEVPTIIQSEPDVAIYFPVFADLDADGDVDMCVKKDDSPLYPIVIYLNDGSGNYSRHSEIEGFDGRNPHWYPEDAQRTVFVKDMDQDGAPDIVLYSSAKNSDVLLKNDGDLNFARLKNILPEPASTLLFIRDLDRDGIFDLVYSSAYPAGNARVYFGKGDLEWNQPVHVGEVQIEKTVLADFNSDGLLDMVLKSGGPANKLEYYTQGPDRTFRLEGSTSLPNKSAFWDTSYIIDIKAADMDLDGFPELLVGSSYDNFRIFDNSGKGLFNQPPFYIFDPGFFRNPNFYVQDLNRDTYPDLIVRAGTYAPRIWLNRSSFASVSGSVFTEFTGDCSDEEQVHPIARRIVEFNPGGLLALSNSRGEFAKYLPAGEYTATMPEEELWTEACQISEYDVTLESDEVHVKNLDFPRAPKQFVSGLDLSVASSRMRPGRIAEYILHFANVGTVPYSGLISLNLDVDLEYISSSVEPISVEPGLLQWEIKELPYAASGQIIVRVEVPRSAAPGEEFCAQVEARLKQSDILLGDRIDEICTQVTASYDPNDIRVWPRGSGTLGKIAGDVKTLSYMIRFQNTGNDTAFTVVLKNKLPAALNLKKIRFGAASHEYSVDISNNNTLEFTFDNILLPDSTTDLLGSQGYVKYRIDLQEDLAPGTQIRNQAGIYFDFNPVVLTNYAVTTIGEAVTSVEPDPAAEINAESLSLYPNPTTEMLTVSGLASGTETLAIVDVHGRELKRLLVDGQTNITVSCQDLAPGSYFLQTRGVGLPRMARFVVVR